MNRLPDFSQLVEIFKDVWQHGLLGVDVAEILTALFIFALFFVLRKPLTSRLLKIMSHAVSKTKSTADDEVLEALKSPVRFLPVVVGVFCAIEYIDLVDETFLMLANNLVRSLVAFNVFWVIYSLILPLSGVFKPLGRMFSPELVYWLVKVLRVGVLFVGIATILEIWGINVGALVAGLGLVGIAGALGAQDLVKNLISGLLILAEDRFKRGDWVCIEDTVEGTVEELGFRSTLIRRFDKAPVYVPNAKLADEVVVNFSKMTHRRIYWKIGVVYGTTVEQLKTIRDGIEKYVAEGAEFASPPDVPLFVRIDSFNSSSIDILLYCFTNTTNWGEWLEIKERLAYHIKQVVEGADSSFAFPSQSLYIEQFPGEKPEAFLPPAEK